MVILGVALEFTRADAHERQPVAVRLVHIRLNFEHKRRKIGAEGIDKAAIGLAGERTRRHAQELLQKRFHTEVGERRAKEHRRKLTAANLFHVKLPARAKQLHVVFELVVLFLADDLGDLRIIQLRFQLFGAVFARHAREQQQLALAAVIHALELLA